MRSQTDTCRQVQNSAKPCARGELCEFERRAASEGHPAPPAHSLFSSYVFLFAPGIFIFFSFPWQQLLGGFTSLTPAVAVHTLKQFLSQATLWNESEKLRCYKHRGAGFLCVSWGMRIQVNPIDLSRRWLNVCLGFGGNQ